MAKFVFSLFLLMVLSLATVNVRSVKSSARCKMVLESLSAVKADVLFLQECGIPFKECYKDLKNAWKCGASVWSGTNVCKNAGVAVLFKGNGIEMRNTTVVECGRGVVVDVEWMGKEVRLINVYASPDKNERAELFERMRGYVTTSKTVVWGGDFNCMLSGSDRKGECVKKLDKTSKLLGAL